MVSSCRQPGPDWRAGATDPSRNQEQCTSTRQADPKYLGKWAPRCATGRRAL